jgi:hypothetical protein
MNNTLLMPYRDIIIKINNQDIHFSPTLSIPVRQTNLPMESMTFRFHGEIYWRIELIEYYEDTKCWHVKVSDYSVNNNQPFSKQSTTRQIEKVVFNKLDWHKLEPLLSSYKAINLIDILYNHDINTVSQSNDLSFRPDIPFNQASYEIPEEIPNHFIQPKYTIPQEIPNHFIQTKFENHQRPIVPKIDYLKNNFLVKFQDATFIAGFVTFKKFIKQLGIQIEFRIQNDYILEEFDNIKLWFSKMFKSKRFDVSATITTVDRLFSEASAVSSLIDMITPDIIEGVKFDRTIALKKTPKPSNPDKSLYSTDEIFNLLDPDMREGNVFSQSESDIIKSLTQSDHVRNRKQLEYLSDTKQTTKSKIHYTLHPLFGFLFLIEGKEKFHFVWELLQSHSTYIWSIDKEEKEVVILYSKIEEILNIIRLIGREKYKRTYSNRNLGFDFIFKAIDHQDISINLDDGFTKWKSKLVELLT